MSRKQLITIAIIVLALIIFGGLFGFYYYLNQKTVSSPYSTSPLSLFTNFFGGTSNTPSGTSGNTNSSSGSTTTGVFIPGSTGSSTFATSVPLLRHITTTPIAGDTSFDRVIGTTTITTSKGAKKVVNVIGTFIRYVDRATGQVFETATSTLTVDRVSNTTFPTIYNALFDTTGESLILQKIQNTDNEIVTTYYGHLVKMGSTSDKTLSTQSISNNSPFVAVSPAGNKLFSIVKTSGGSAGVLSALDGSGKSTIWTSPLSEWLPLWTNTSQILLTTKPSADVVGYSYLLSPTTGTFTKYVGYIPGLTVLPSPDLSLALISQSNSAKGNFSLSLFNTKDHSTNPFALNTLPEKCVWGSVATSSIVYCAVPTTIPSALYPDDWYKGAVSFSDSIWKINIATGEANRIADLTTLSGKNIDATSLTLDPEGDYLLFTDKNDLSLWGLRVR